MPSHNEMDPLANAPPLEVTGDDRRALILLGLGSALIAVLALLGLRCAFHDVASLVAYLRS